MHRTKKNLSFIARPRDPSKEGDMLEVLKIKGL